MLIYMTIDELWDCMTRGRGRAIPREKGEENLFFLSLEREISMNNEISSTSTTYILLICNYQTALCLKCVYTDTDG